MLIDKLLDKTIPGLEKALDLTWRRNEAISGNIANTETPKYRAADLDFGRELDRAFGQQDKTLVRTNARHMDVTSSSGAHLVADLTGATKGDGNNVDLDIQMGKLAFNSGKYTQAANIVRKKFQLLGSAIRQTVG